MRVLLFSWEYPPVIEGGLGRHVRKLSEQLAAEGVEVHVLTRGGGHLPVEESRRGVRIHRVAEPPFPKEIEAFVRWVGDMNQHMAALGTELAERFEFDLVHSHDWLVADAAEGASRARAICPGWSRSTRPSTAVTRAGSRTIPNPISTPLSAAWHAAQTTSSPALTTWPGTWRGSSMSHLAISPQSRTASIRPTWSPPQASSWCRCERASRRRTSGWCCLSGDSCSRRASIWLSRRSPRSAGDGRLRFVVAGTGTAEAELKAQAEALGLSEYGSFIGWAGDDLLHSNT